MNLIKSHSTLGKQLLHASYRVAHRIAKSMKPHTLGKRLIKPCAVDLMKIFMDNDEAGKKLQQSPLPNHVISTEFQTLAWIFLTKQFPV